MAGFQIAIFSFQGIEMAGAASAETANPERTLPKAINSIPVRVVVFYVFALAVIMAVQPWDLIDPDVNPFVEMFSFIGIPIAFHLVNFVVLTSAASSANSGVFYTSRIMYSLANDANAPASFAKLNSRAIPAKALALTALCISPAIALVMLSDTVIDAFSMVAGVSSVLYISVWAMILVSYLCYLKKYPERHEASVYKLRAPRFTCYATLVFFVLILVALGLEPSSRISLIAMPIWFVLLVIIYRIQAPARRTMPTVD